MKRAHAWTAALAALAITAAACGLGGSPATDAPEPAPAEVEGGAEAEAEDALEAIEVEEEPTATPGGGFESEGGGGVAFEWTHMHEGGMTTSGRGFTCGGGAWHIDFASVWVDPDFTAETSGALDFEVVDGASGVIELPTEGTIVVLQGGELTVVDPLDFSLTLHDDGQSASLYFNSTGAGIMFAPGTEDDPDSMGTVFPGEEFEVALVPYSDCGG